MACGDKNPVGPSPTPPPSGIPQSIEIAGRTSLDRPGDMSQLTAVVTLSDGTTRNVTAEAEWVMDHPDVVSVSPGGGLLKALTYGECHVTVRYGSLSARLRVRVAPGGMFLLRGQVTDEQDAPVWGTTVEVTSPEGIFSCLTNQNGTFTLPARGDIVIRVRMDGFDEQARQLVVTGDKETHFQLRLSGGEFTGAYHLSFTASPSCTTLPADAMRRQYVARIRETGQGIFVELTGADFSVWGWAGFTGWRDGSTVRFEITSSYNADYQFIEALAGDRELAFSGTALGEIRDSLVATFGGEVLLRTRTGQTIARCEAVDHRLEFTR